MGQVVIATIPEEVDQMLPARRPDGSGIGVNYADAFAKKLATTLEDGRAVALKRRGLQLTLTVGEAKATALMDRWGGQGNAETILHATMTKLAEQLGYRYRYDNRQVIFED